MRVVIVGGVAAGAAMATRLRRLNESLEIIVVEKGDYASFANCALPYYLGGTVADRDALFAASPEYLRSFYKLDLRLNCEAVEIRASSRRVIVKNADAASEELSYDALVIATGTRTELPQFARGLTRVMPLKSVPDTDAVAALLNEDKRHALIVGGGAVGLESCECLLKRGCEVTLCEASDHLLTGFDPEMASYARFELSRLNADVRLKTTVTAFSEDAEGIFATFSDGTEARFDFVLWCAGNVPNTEFAVAAGAEADARGYLKTDKHMRTTLKDVYAVGDAALIRNKVTGIPFSCALATPISKEVRAAAGVIAGVTTALHTFDGALSTSIVRTGRITSASCGLSESQCDSQGVKDATCIYTHAFSHPGFYPEARRVHVKLLFRLSDGKIYGVQAVGENGVDKVIEAFSTVMGMGGTVHDLVERDQAYAPPFSAVRDVAGMTAAVAQNACDGLFKPVTFRDLPKFSDALKIDVRPAKSFAQAHPEGFVSIPASAIRQALEDIPKDRTILISCMVGQSAYVSARILSCMGYRDVHVLSGSLLTLKAAGVPLVTDAAQQL